MSELNEFDEILKELEESVERTEVIIRRSEETVNKLKEEGNILPGHYSMAIQYKNVYEHAVMLLARPMKNSELCSILSNLFRNFKRAEIAFVMADELKKYRIPVDNMDVALFMNVPRFAYNDRCCYYFDFDSVVCVNGNDIFIAENADDIRIAIINLFNKYQLSGVIFVNLNKNEVDVRSGNIIDNIIKLADSSTSTNEQ